MGTNYLIGGSSGTVNNGGGWVDGYDATFANSMADSNGTVVASDAAPVVATHDAGAAIKITHSVSGSFADVKTGHLANCDFSAGPSADRYRVKEVDAGDSAHAC